MPPKRPKGRTYYPSSEELQKLYEDHAKGSTDGILDLGEYVGRDGPFLPIILAWRATLHAHFVHAPSGLVSWGRIKQALKELYTTSPRQDPNMKARDFTPALSAEQGATAIRRMCFSIRKLALYPAKRAVLFKALDHNTLETMQSLVNAIHVTATQTDGHESSGSEVVFAAPKPKFSAPKPEATTRELKPHCSIASSSSFQSLQLPSASEVSVSDEEQHEDVSSSALLPSKLAERPVNADNMAAMATPRPALKKNKALSKRLSSSLLPPGCEKIVKVRKHGATAGSKDTYYIDNNGVQYRSLIQAGLKK